MAEQRARDGRAAQWSRRAGSLGVALACAALVAAAGSTLAAPDDRDQPVEITADRAELDRDGGVASYYGDAVLQQGSLRVTGARIVVRTRDGRLHEAKAQGQPATIRQREADGRHVRGRANRIRYDAAKPLVTLTGGAELLRGGDRLDAARIEYWPDSGRVEARGSDSGQVRIRLAPGDGGSDDGG